MSLSVRMEVGTLVVKTTSMASSSFMLYEDLGTVKNPRGRRPAWARAIDSLQTVTVSFIIGFILIQNGRMARTFRKIFLMEGVRERRVQLLRMDLRQTRLLTVVEFDYNRLPTLF